jgi:hypothetical protein
MSELSHAASAVLDAYAAKSGWLGGPLPRDYHCIAAVLRAVVSQVLPENANPVSDAHDAARADQWLRIRLKILAIAAELEAQ